MVNSNPEANISQNLRQRGRSRPDSPVKTAWLATFADMVTLLLTFLVLIISFATMDPRTTFLLSQGVLEDTAEFEQTADGTMSYSDRAMLAPVVELIENLNELPPDMALDQDVIKNAIFQLDPPENVAEQSTGNDEGSLTEIASETEAADDGIEIYHDDRGFVLRWDLALLFPEGNTVLQEENLPLLEKMVALLKDLPNQLFSIESHTNPLSPLEGGETKVAYDLGMARSEAILDYFLKQGLNEKKFRLASFGGSQPRTLDPEMAWENSRLEIVIYKPDPLKVLGR